MMAASQRPRGDYRARKSFGSGRQRSRRALRLEPLEQRQVLSVSPVPMPVVQFMDVVFDESAMVGRLDNTMTVTIETGSGTSKLDAWIDLNGDGSYGGAWERIASGVDVSEGENLLTFDIPASARSGEVYARLLVSSEGNLAPGGPAGEGDHLLTILPPAPGGFFGPPQQLAGPIDPPRSADAADFDDDGDWDIVMATDVGLGRLTNAEAGEAASAYPTGGSLQARSVFVADRDGNGQPGYLATTNDSTEVTWFDNDGSSDTVTTGHGEIASLAAADMDGDGDLDAIAASFYANEIAWYENDGSDQFDKHLVSDQATWTEHVLAADLDHDGDIDLVSGQRASDGLDALAWFENDGSGQFSTHPVHESAAVPALAHNWFKTTSLESADLDGDGDVDLVASLRQYSRLPTEPYSTVYAWYENDGFGSFAFHELTAISAIQGDANLVTLTPADLDGDGDKDLVVRKSGRSPLYWYTNDGTGAFGEAYAFDATGIGIPVDVDGDGDLDLVADNGLNQMVWFENQPGEPASQLGDVDIYHGICAPDGDGYARLSLRTTHSGLLTILVDLGELIDGQSESPSLQLLDANQQAVGTSSTDGSILRIDYQTVTAGDELTLVLSGVTSNVELTICNLVELSDGQLTVHDGTSVRYLLGDANQLTVDNVVYDTSTWELSGTTLQGNDVEVVGSDASETAVLSPFTAHFTNPQTGFEVTIESDKIVLNSSEGDDTIHINDSAGDDSLYVDPDELTFDGGLDNNFSHTAFGFETVLAYSKNGGYDRVTVNLPEQRAKVSPELTKSIGEQYVRCKFFEDLSITADRAVVWGSEQVDSFQTIGNVMTIDYGQPPSQNTFDFNLPGEVTRIDNMLIVLDDPGCLEKAWIQADSIRAYGSGDSLVMHDFEGDDVLIAKPHKVVMANAPQTDNAVGRGDLYEVIARGFGDVRIIADQGGNDVAKLYDSADEGVDVWAAAYVESQTWSTMSSPKRTFYRVWDFESVGGYGFNGGLGETHGTNAKDHTEAANFVYERGTWEDLQT